jgi:hypothetical protein
MNDFRINPNETEREREIRVCQTPAFVEPQPAKELRCRNCNLPIKPLLDPWGGQHGWYHPTIEKEVNIDGADVMVHATSCPDDKGEAEPPEPILPTEIRCPQCQGATAPEYDDRWHRTGKRICIKFTCPQKAFFHIPTAQQVEATARVLGPMHEAGTDEGGHA